MMATAQANLTKARVLVVDDERMIADTMATILNQAGFNAIAAYSGEGAAEIFPRFEPEMLISDIIMTGMTGFDLAILVHQSQPNCKVLLMSGHAATANLMDGARQQGLNFEVHARPMFPQALLSKVRGWDGARAKR